MTRLSKYPNSVGDLADQSARGVAQNLTEDQRIALWQFPVHIGIAPTGDFIGFDLFLSMIMLGLFEPKGHIYSLTDFGFLVRGELWNIDRST